MVEVRQTAVFQAWFGGLRDRRAIERIAMRIVRLEAGLFGDVKPVGGGVSEMKIEHGPGCRVYFSLRGKLLVILLCGGDKSTQDIDIKAAKALAAGLRETKP